MSVEEPEGEVSGAFQRAQGFVLGEESFVRRGDREEEGLHRHYKAFECSKQQEDREKQEHEEQEHEVEEGLS